MKYAIKLSATLIGSAVAAGLSLALFFLAGDIEDDKWRENWHR